MSRNAMFCGVRRWSPTGSRTGALVIGKGTFCEQGSGMAEASGHHGERLSPEPGDFALWGELADLEQVQAERLSPGGPQTLTASEGLAPRRDGRSPCHAAALLNVCGRLRGAEVCGHGGPLRSGRPRRVWRKSCAHAC